MLQLPSMNLTIYPRSCLNSDLVELIHVSRAGSLDWVHICRSASKVVTFIDLAGHEKYLKTTIFGMTGHAPDFCMLMVGSNAGVIGMTKGLRCVLWSFVFGAFAYLTLLEQLQCISAVSDRSCV